MTYSSLPSAGGGSGEAPTTQGVMIQRAGSPDLFFADIAAAAAASQDGDAIKTSPGDHSCSGLVLPARVSVGPWSGVAYSSRLVSGTTLLDPLTASASGSVFEDLEILLGAGAQDAISSSTNSVGIKFKGCLFSGPGDSSLEVFNMSGGSFVEIMDCVSTVAVATGFVRVTGTSKFDVDGLRLKASAMTVAIRSYGTTESRLRNAFITAEGSITYAISMDNSSTLRGSNVHIRGASVAVYSVNASNKLYVNGLYLTDCTTDVGASGSSVGTVMHLMQSSVDGSKMDLNNTWFGNADLILEAVERYHDRTNGETGKITQFDSLQAAIDSSSHAGDSIATGYGDVTEDILVNVTDLTIAPKKGLGTTRLIGTGNATDRITITAPGCILRNMEIQTALNSPRRGALVALPSASDKCTFDGVFLYGKSGGNAEGVALTKGFLFAQSIVGMQDNFNSLVDVSGAESRLLAESIKALAGNYVNVVSVQNGAVATIRSLDVLPTANVTDGLLLGGATATVLGGFIDGAAVGIHFNAETSHLVCFNTHILNCPVDLKADAGLTGIGSTVDFGSGSIAAERMDAPVGWAENVNPSAMFFERSSAGNNVKIWGANLSIGSPWKNAEITVGRGQSSTANIRIKRKTAAGVFDDIQDLTKAGTSTDLFSDLAIGSEVYFGNPWQFCNLKARWTLASSPTFNSHFAGGAVAICEKFNGATWERIEVMWRMADAGVDGKRRSSHTEMANAVRQEHMHLGPGWDTNVATTVDGDLRYWLRFRLIAPLTISPKLDLLKVGLSRMEFDEAGSELYGYAAPKADLIKGWHASSLRELAGWLMQDENIPMGGGDFLVVTNNKFQGNRDDGVGGQFSVPWNLDTSWPLHLDLNVFPATVGVSALADFQFELFVVNDGQIYGSTIGIVVNQQETVPNISTLEKFLIHVDFNLNGFATPVQPESSMFVKVKRLGASGITGNDIAIGGSHIHGVRWSFGV